MPSRISMVKSSSYDLLVQYRYFVSCSGSHLHQSKSINIFYTGKTWAFSRRHLRQSKKKKRKSREVRIEWEKRERSGSNGKKNGGLGRVEKGGRLKETLIRLNKERGLDRVKRRREAWTGWKNGGKSSRLGLLLHATRPKASCPFLFCSCYLVLFYLLNVTAGRKKVIIEAFIHSGLFTTSRFSSLH